MSNQGDSRFTQGLLLGTIIGGAVGAMTALLFAPKTGDEFRKEILDKSKDFYDKTSDYIYTTEANLGSAFTQTINEGRVKAQNIIDSAKERADEILENAEKILNDTKTKASDTKNDISTKFDNVKGAAKASADTFKSELNK